MHLMSETGCAIILCKWSFFYAAPSKHTPTTDVGYLGVEYLAQGRLTYSMQSSEVESMTLY